MSELTGLSVLQMRDGLLAKKFSAADLCREHLKRIAATNTKFNTFLTVCEDQALASANEADKVLAREKEKSPLLTGIPVAIKDMLVTKDIATSCASKILKGFIPPYDCTAVLRLKDQGAVVLGKTNLDEFAMGASNENSAFGPVKNPWDTSRVSGGSSGGSAVSVSLGQAALSLGTDTGGSIRQPAAFCGVVGIKPTYGRVSRYGAVAFASSLDQIGPFGRSVEDVALALQVIAGQDQQDSTSMDVPVPNYLEEVRNLDRNFIKTLRVGVPKEFFVPGMDAEVESRVKEGIQVLKGLGAKIVDISLPHTEYAIPVYYIINPAEASSNLARYDGVRYGHRTKSATNLSEMYEKTRDEGFGPEVKRRILIGTYVLSAGYFDAYYLKAQQVRTLIINDYKAAFANDCDVIAAPTTPTTAFKLGEKSDSPLQMYLADILTCPINLAGLPGISVPCGLDSAKLPIGLQLIGPPFSELRLLQVAQAFSKELAFDVAKMTREAF